MSKIDLAGQSLDLISLEPETHLANEHGLQICFLTFSIRSSDRLFENLVQFGHAGILRSSGVFLACSLSFSESLHLVDNDLFSF